MRPPYGLVPGARAFLERLTGWRADLAAVALGMASALALPPLHGLPVLLATMPGLLVLVGAAPNWWGALRRGFWFGFGGHLVGLYWITEAILVESAAYWWLVPLAVPGLSALLSPFVAGPCALARAVPAGWRRVAMLAGSWVAFDLARQFIGTGFPWNPLGSAWAVPGPVGDVFLQPAALVSVHGLTLATLLLAATPMGGRRAVAGGAALLAAWAAYGTARLHGAAQPDTGWQVVLVQGNVPEGEKHSPAHARAVFDRYLHLTRAGVAELAGRPGIVVWPESSFPGWLVQDREARDMVADAARPAGAALIGSLRWPLDGAGKPEPAPRNSLVALDPAGTVRATYDKWHLVPFGEYAPGWVPLAVQIVPGSFGFGPGPRTLHLPGVPPVGPIICYEAIFPAQVVDEADRPDWIVNITNDAWFGDSTGPRQHLAAARLRAVEEGLPVLRAANTGISAAYDALGRERARLGLDRAGTLVVPLPGRLPPTPFARLGLIVPLLLALAGMALSLLPRRARPG